MRSSFLAGDGNLYSLVFWLYSSPQSCCQRCWLSTNAKEALHDCADEEDLQAGGQPAKRTQKVALTHLDEEEDEEG